MADPLSTLVSITDLAFLSEVFSEHDDEFGKPVRLGSSFGYITHDHVVYTGSSQLGKFDLTIELVRQSMERIPDHQVYPETTQQLTMFDGSCNIDCFVKGPRLSSGFAGTTLAAKLMLDEAGILQSLLAAPHPNIALYHGCLVERDRIVGLVFKRYGETLDARAGHDLNDLNVAEVMAQLKSAIEHLHSHNLAHNDLKPSNIMMDENGAAVVIDFGSCRPFGEELLTGGTPEWTGEDVTTSDPRHDERGLSSIRSWLESLASRR